MNGEWNIIFKTARGIKPNCASEFSLVEAPLLI